MDCQASIKPCPGHSHHPLSKQSYFTAHVPVAAPGERLAALLWSPPAARRLLLAVTAGGRAWAWTMDAPPSSGTPARNGGGGSAANGANGGSGGGSGELRVACVNDWHGRHAFDLPLAAATAEAGAADPHQQQQQQQQQRGERLVSCRFLQPPAGAGAAWDTAAAPPYADRQGWGRFGCRRYWCRLQHGVPLRCRLSLPPSTLPTRPPIHPCSGRSHQQRWWPISSGRA